MSMLDGDVVRVAARQQFASGQDLVNVWHFVAEFADPQQDQDVVDEVLAALDIIYSQLNGMISNTVLPVDVKIDLVEWIGGEEKVVRTLGTHSWVGTWYDPTGSGDVLPPGAAALLKNRTLYGKVYGRKFFGGFTETSQNDGSLTSAAMTAMALAAVEVLEARVISAGNTLYSCIMSTKFASAMRFTESVATAIIAYQRRRRPGTGS